MEGAFAMFVLIAWYFAPTAIATFQKKKNTAAIFLLNFLTGWTVIGWIAALIWAATKDN